MPQHKSCEKRVKTNAKSNQRNVGYKTQMKSSVKKIRSITDKEAIQDELKKTYSLLDKLASKKIIHKNKAANQKSKLSKYANSLS
jgi:small subunit ribosomal protein S20